MGREIEEFEHIYPEGVLNMFMALANEIIGWQISNCIPRLPIIFDGTSFFAAAPARLLTSYLRLPILAIRRRLSVLLRLI